ncbi:MAG: decaprenyl-phosphate phosphoribosyltransferase [Ktedonobacterales bacterium]
MQQTGQEPSPAADLPTPPGGRQIHQAAFSASESLSQRGISKQLRAAVVEMRPKQWTKNGLVLLALVFSHNLTNLPAVSRVLLAFLAFSLAASAVYIINDLADRETDRVHPTKSRRPIASGQLSIPAAGITASACLLGSLGFTYWLVAYALPAVADPFLRWGGASRLFVATIAGYIVLNLLYTLWLKHQVLWDIFIIAAGFVLRALAGAIAIPVPISPWFYLCTTFLALFLALGKRRAELVLLSNDAANHRKNLREYSPQLLDQLMSVVVTCTLITYCLYTFQGENGYPTLMVTIPFVLFGVFRYLYLVYVKNEGSHPDELLYRDKQLLGAVALCILVILALLYGAPLLRS